MYLGHRLGTIVRLLRARRLAGATIPELLEFMQRVLPGSPQGGVSYLGKAFCCSLDTALTRPNSFGTPEPGAVAYAELKIDEHRAIWENQDFPVLMRLRDYFSFLQFATEEGLHVFVCGSRPDEKAYRLHGVYDAVSGQPAWTARRGERLRTAINRRLGGELVLSGPHDDWEHRNDAAIAGASRGPLLPVIEFDHERQIQNHFTAQSLATSWVYQHHWARLFPDHPVTS